MAITYNVKKLTAELEAGKKKHAAAIEAATKDTKVALAKLAQDFVAGGFQQMSTDEPVLVTMPGITVENYDRVLKILSLVSGDSISSADLPKIVDDLIDNAGNVSTGKHKVSIGVDADA